MNSAKLKNILILLFLAVNLFFLYKLTELMEEKNVFPEEQIKESVDILNTKGILIDTEDVLTNKTVPKTLRLDWDVSAIEQTAGRIMKNSYGSFNVPNGHSFTNDSESFSFFYDYSFEYRRLDLDVSPDSVRAVLVSDDGMTDGKPFEKQLNKLFDCGKDAKASIRVEKCISSGGKVYLHARQLIDGTVSDGAELYAVIRDSQIEYLSGIFYLCNNAIKYVTDSLDSINVLFELEPGEARVEQMELIYVPVTETTDCIYLVPSYKFTYSDGNTAIYDAASGTKRK